MHSTRAVWRFLSEFMNLVTQTFIATTRLIFTKRVLTS